jgi:hypothetical protein
MSARGAYVPLPRGNRRRRRPSLQWSQWAQANILLIYLKFPTWDSIPLYPYLIRKLAIQERHRPTPPRLKYGMPQRMHTPLEYYTQDTKLSWVRALERYVASSRRLGDSKKSEAPWMPPRQLLNAFHSVAEDEAWVDGGCVRLRAYKHQ